MLNAIIDISSGLKALESIRIDKNREIGGVLKNIPEDVPSINAQTKSMFAKQIDIFAKSSANRFDSILPIIGTAGSGKTHILSDFYLTTINNNGIFIPVDLSTLLNVYELINETIINMITIQNDNRPSQLSRILKNLLIDLKYDVHPNRNVEKFLESNSDDNLLAIINLVIDKIQKKFRQKNFLHNDVIRAVMLLASKNYNINLIGRCILKSVAIDDGDKDKFGFLSNQNTAKNIFYGLTWLFSLGGSFTVFAFDQFDALIPKQTNNNDSDILDYNKIARVFITDLSEIITYTQRCFIVLNMFAETWNKINSSAYFNSKISNKLLDKQVLLPVNNIDDIEQLVFKILHIWYAKNNFQPPYKTWPFPKRFFETTKGLYAREILHIMYDHIEDCKRNREVFEWGSLYLPKTDEFPEEIQTTFHEILEKYQKQTIIFKDENQETKFWHDALISFVECFGNENMMAIQSHTFEPEYQSSINPKKPSADAKLHLLKDGITKKTFTLWAITKYHHLSFQSQLKSAMKSSGIKHDLDIRRLMIIHPKQIPTGPKTAIMWKEFLDSGGIELMPDNNLIATLHAIDAIRTQYPEFFEPWAKTTKPTSLIGSLEKEMKKLFNL